MPRNSVRLFVGTVIFFGMAIVNSLALNVPVFAEAATNIQSSFYPGRAGRALDWDEKYLLSVGIDSLRQAEFGLDLEIRAEEKLDGFSPSIHTLLLGWERNSHCLVVGTRNIGLASGYDFADRFVAYHSYNDWLFESTRLNSIQYRYRNSVLSVQADLGGNQISRGIASLGIGLAPYGQEFRGGIRASVSDTHWHSPSLIANLGMTLKLDAFTQRADLMVKEVMAHKDRPARQEYALATEIAYQLSSGLGFSAGGLYEEREFAPRRKSEFHTALDWRRGKLYLSPYFATAMVNDNREESYGAILSLRPFPHGNLGLIYKYESGPYDEIRHVIAIQTDLRFDL